MSLHDDAGPADAAGEAIRRVAGCPFCERIKAGDYDYCDARAVAFQPRRPVTAGHFLVVPRRHVASAIAAPDHAACAMRFAASLARRMGLEAANFITSAGTEATQTVFHLHVHIVPRREGDGLHLPWTGQKSAEAVTAK